MSSIISIMDTVEGRDPPNPSTGPQDEKKTKILEKEIKIEILNNYEAIEQERLQTYNRITAKPRNEEAEPFGKEKEQGQRIQNQKNSNTYHLQGENFANVGGSGNTTIYDSHERRRQEHPQDGTPSKKVEAQPIEVENTNIYHVNGDGATIGNIGGKRNTAIMRELNSYEREDSGNQAPTEREKAGGGNEIICNFHGATSVQVLSSTNPNESRDVDNLEEGEQEEAQTTGTENEKYEKYETSRNYSCDKVDLFPVEISLLVCGAGQS